MPSFCTTSAMRSSQDHLIDCVLHANDIAGDNRLIIIFVASVVGFLLGAVVREYLRRYKKNNKNGKPAK